MTKYEWGVWSNVSNSLWLAGMTQAEAEDWVRSWDALPDNGRGLFSVCRRPVGGWELSLGEGMFSIVYDS